MFRIYKSNKDILIENHGKWFEILNSDWDHFINRRDLFEFISAHLSDFDPLHSTPEFVPDAPISRQEVWAAGVTYLRSKIARMEEAEAAGGGNFYDRVYDAARPEIFFKATPARVSGPEEDVFIRRDSTWDVPEPELTLFISGAGTIEGYTIGNDMSSRSIEGENPLYLPQAKTYERCAALGPCIMVIKEPISPATRIHMRIFRQNLTMYDQSVEISQMKRTHEELASYLFRELDFPYGVFLMTGTCLVPDHPFTLEQGDQIEIGIDQIGILQNRVAKKGLVTNMEFDV